MGFLNSTTPIHEYNVNNIKWWNSTNLATWKLGFFLIYLLWSYEAFKCKYDRLQFIFHKSNVLYYYISLSISKKILILILEQIAHVTRIYILGTFWWKLTTMIDIWFIRIVHRWKLSFFNVYTVGGRWLEGQKPKKKNVLTNNNYKNKETQRIMKKFRTRFRISM